jgi:hypothetical protein
MVIHAFEVGNIVIGNMVVGAMTGRRSDAKWREKRRAEAWGICALRPPIAEAEQTANVKDAAMFMSCDWN